jgi:hypothetical protein
MQNRVALLRCEEGPSRLDSKTVHPAPRRGVTLRRSLLTPGYRLTALPPFRRLLNL